MRIAVTAAVSFSDMPLRPVGAFEHLIMPCIDSCAVHRGEKPMAAPQSNLKREEKNKLFKKGEAEEGTVAEGIESEV